MANETKAKVASWIDESKLYLCIPAAAAREFLEEIIDIGEYAAVEARSYGTPYDESAGKKLADKARALLAKLPEEEK